MLRSVTLGVALSVLATACALDSPPAGSALFRVQIRNASMDRVELAVGSDTGDIPGGVQPASVGPRRNCRGNLRRPNRREEWWLNLSGPNRDANDFRSVIEGSSVEGLAGQSCAVVIILRENRNDVACLAR